MIRQQKAPSHLTSGGPVRVHREADGRVHVVADLTPRGFSGAFPVRLEGKNARVGQGLMAGLVPAIRGVPLDGRVGDRIVRVPSLPLTDPPDEALLRSWICCRVQVDLKSGKLDPENPEVAVIVHVTDLAKVFANGVSPDDGQGRGHLPLAMLVWRDEKRVQRVVQNVFFHQRHSFVPVANGRRAFHIFHPAA